MATRDSLLKLCAIAALSACTIFEPGLSVVGGAGPDGADCSPLRADPVGDGAFTYRVLTTCDDSLLGSVQTDRDGDHRDDLVSFDGACVLVHHGCDRSSFSCAPGATPGTSRVSADAVTKSDVDRDGRVDLIRADEVSLRIALHRGDHIDLVTAPMPQTPDGETRGRPKEILVLPRPNGTSLIVVGSYGSGGNSVLDPARMPPDLCTDPQGFLTDARILSNIQLPRIKGWVFDPAASTLTPAADPAFSVTEADALGSACTDFDGDGWFMCLIADEHGVTDLVQDGPTGLRNVTEERLGKFYLNGMGAFVTADDRVAISGTGSSAVFRWTGARFTYGRDALNPTSRQREMWDCHWVDVDSDGYPDQICGGNGRPGGGFNNPEVQSGITGALGGLAPALRSLLGWFMLLARETAPHELISHGRPDGTFEDLRFLLADGASTNRMGLLDLGAGRLGIVRYLTGDDGAGGTGPLDRVTINEVVLAGRPTGHGLNVRLRGYPLPGTTFRLTCEGRPQVWRFWEAGRAGSHPEFAHFGCRATTHGGLRVTARDGRTLADCAAGPMDRSISIDADGSCREIPPAP